MTRLTQREREVVALLAAGKRQAEIAELLCVTKHMVKAHAAHARNKAGVKTTAELTYRVAMESER